MIDRTGFKSVLFIFIEIHKLLLKINKNIIRDRKYICLIGFIEKD